MSALTTYCMMTYYVNRYNNYGIRYVMDAIETNDLERLKQLADYGATLHHTDANKYFVQIQRTDREMCHTTWLSKPVWERPLYLEPPICLAVRMNDYNIVEYLLSKNIDVNSIQANGNTLLYLAVKNRNYTMVTLLLNHNANPNIQNVVGKTPIWDVIADNEHYKMVELLLKHQASTLIRNIHGQTLLHEILYNNQYYALPILIEKGCDINAVDHDGYTPLARAIYFKCETINPNIVKQLLKYGADPTIPNKFKVTAIMMVKSSEIKNIFERWLIDNLLD